MAKRKDTPATPGEQIAQQILANYDIKTAQDIQDVLKSIFAPMFEVALKGEWENHLGYEKHAHATGTNSRNGYSSKTIKTSLGKPLSGFPVTVKAPSSRRSSRSIRKTFLPSKARCSPCTPAA